MIIKLHEIPDHGQDFEFNNKEGTLNDSLKDVVQENPYFIKMSVRPAGQAFDARGNFHVELKEQCSFCAKEIKQEIKNRFHEILMFEDKTKCSIESKDVHADEEISVTNLTSHLFDVSEFLHEMIALNQPHQPVCKPDCKGLCLTCGEDLNETQCHCKAPENTKENAFSILKNLKLN